MPSKEKKKEKKKIDKNWSKSRAIPWNPGKISFAKLPWRVCKY